MKRLPACTKAKRERSAKRVAAASTVLMVCTAWAKEYANSHRTSRKHASEFSPHPALKSGTYSSAISSFSLLFGLRPVLGNNSSRNFGKFYNDSNNSRSCFIRNNSNGHRVENILEKLQCQSLLKTLFTFFLFVYIIGQILVLFGFI
jgi:hypothetical protein